MRNAIIAGGTVIAVLELMELFYHPAKAIAKCIDCEWGKKTVECTGVRLECCKYTNDYNLVPYETWGSTPADKVQWYIDNNCNNVIGGKSMENCNCNNFRRMDAPINYHCDLGCSVIMDIVETKHHDLLRDLVEEGMSSSEIVQMVVPAVQDDCIELIVETAEKAAEQGSLTHQQYLDIANYNTCVGFTEMVLRVDPDVVIFEWLQEFGSRATRSNSEVACGASVSKLQHLAFKKAIAGVTAEVKTRSWEIHDFQKKYELSSKLSLLDISVSGILAISSVFLNLLTKGSTLILAMCPDFMDDQDAALLNGDIGVNTNVF